MNVFFLRHPRRIAGSLFLRTGSSRKKKRTYNDDGEDCKAMAKQSCQEFLSRLSPERTKDAAGGLPQRQNRS